MRHSGRNFFSAFDSEITVFGDILRNTAKERQRTARNSSAELLNTLTRQSELENLISRSYQNITRADAILESAVNMQTGVRGYLLSGREDFLIPYTAGDKEFHALIASLRETVVDDPAQVLLLSQLEQTIVNWQKWVTRPSIALRRKIGHAKTMDDMADLIGEARGKEYFDQFRGVMVAFNTEGQRLMQDRMASNGRVEDFIGVVIGIVISLGILFGLALAWLIGNGISRPITRMTDVMGALAEGNLEIEVPDQRRRDEVGAMAQAMQVFKYNMAENQRLQIKQQDAEQREKAEQIELADVAASAARKADAANIAKSVFFASMSHEIRTPLNGVIGMISVLEHGELSPEQKKQVQLAKESGEVLQSLLNDILDLSKIEAGHVELELLDFDLQKLLDSVAALWESRLLGKGLTFSIEISPDSIPVLKSDPTRIRQILFNLINNSAKFTHTGGVTVRVAQTILSDDEVETRFEVTDTGIGIAPEAQAQIFSKFTQADGSTTRKYGGSGLGLAICMQLADLLGGDIGVDSEENSGSTFWFTIRCAAGHVADVDSELFTRASDTLQPAATVQSMNILVAEDNSVNQAVIRALLETAGHRLTIVGNGIEAVSAVIRAPYDMMLMDIQMPEMDGITATRKIRDLPGGSGALPIIALTANAMKGDREKYLAAGMTDYVAKPIDPHELMAAIARCSAKMEPSREDRKLVSERQAQINEIPVLDEEVLKNLSDSVGMEKMANLIEDAVEGIRSSLTQLAELKKVPTLPR